MKRSILLTFLLVVCPSLFAIDVDPKLDKAVRDALPVCADAKIAYEAPSVKLPPRFRGALVKVESARHACDGQFLAALSPAGNFYLGGPWPIANEEGQTIEDKLRNFAQRNLREPMSATVDRKATDDGLYPATLSQITEAGKIPLQGLVDPEGQIFFFGSFRNLRDPLGAQRMKSFDAFLGSSPTKGAGASAPVTVVEFSDFQCPSCRRSSGYADTLLAQHGDKVRYIRFDLPLSGHPWAFPAALAGRAIYHQNPELFWTYKKNVYDNQDSLNAFTFWDWARNWAADHDLDLAKYDADLNSAEIKNLILAGAGAAFSNDVRATPTFMVNGLVVDAGEEGKALMEYVAKLAK